MKKILILMCFAIFIQNCASAQNVSFVYINGSNNNNKRMKTWFFDGVTKKLHPAFLKVFKKDKTSVLSANKGITINKEPVIFFWGDKSKTDLEFVEEQLSFSNAFSSAGASVARTMIAKYFHDAIWVQKSHNMLPILDELNEVVKNEWTKGNQTVLYGYSAGSFIAYEYLFNKLPYIDMVKVFETLRVNQETLDYANQNPKKKTCISALKYGNIGVVSSAGHLLIDKNYPNLIKNYNQLDEITEEYCSPKGALKGAVSFANPLVLFYSDIADPNYDINFYNKFLIKYIMENNVFMITVNFREDPLGFPTTQNPTIAEMEDILGFNFENPTGIIYDNSGAWSGRFFIFAHTSYWNAHRLFSKEVAKTLINAEKFQYNLDAQTKMLKKQRKKQKYQ